MEDILILKDKKGGTAVLTTNSPASHYGILVLQITAEDVDGDFGPADLIGDIEKPETIVTAASIVYAWAKTKKRKPHEIEVAKSFLRQWPEGPQIE
jgi:hypothetical protein